MTGATVSDWDPAFANRDHVPDSQALLAALPGKAAAFRAESTVETLSYGDGPRQKIDLFWPRGGGNNDVGGGDPTPRGLVVFLHGGYWMAFDRTDFSHLAAGPLAHGWAVAIPGYTLAPAARIAAMTTDIGAALTVASNRVRGDAPIVVTGHSAGGHLAARMMCRDAPLPRTVSSRIIRAVSISGVHDLRPLLGTSMNNTLGLDTAEAAAESPALLSPREGARVVAWVGADELPEFVRQNALLADRWTAGTGTGAGGTAVRRVEEPGKHHFNVVEGLADPTSPLTEAIVGDSGGLCWGQNTVTNQGSYIPIAPQR